MSYTNSIVAISALSPLLPDEILNNISGGNDEEGYRCSECGKVLDGWWDYQIYFFEHLPWEYL